MDINICRYKILKICSPRGLEKQVRHLFMLLVGMLYVKLVGTLFQIARHAIGVLYVIYPSQYYETHRFTRE